MVRSDLSCSTLRDISSPNGAMTMNNLEQMSRVLCSHVWDDVSQWASALDRLASLSDLEIAALAAGGRTEHSRRPRGTEGFGKARHATGATDSCEAWAKAGARGTSNPNTSPRGCMGPRNLG
jgi:hypothetical protein